MSTTPHCAPRWRLVAPLLLGLLCSATLAPAWALADDNLAIGTTAYVASGEAALLRDAPGYDAAAVLWVDPWTEVQILDGPVWAADGSLWYLVAAWGSTGYLPTWAVAAGGTDVGATWDDGSTWDDGTTADGGWSAPAAATGSGWVVGTNGDGAVCRADAGFWADVIGYLPEGGWVEVTGGVVGEWQPVNCGGQSGYVYASFVGSDQSGWSDGGAAAPAPSGDASAGEVTGYATVVGTNGEGVFCRGDASYDAAVVTIVGEGGQLGLRGGAWGEWQPVVCANSNGFVHAAFLSTGGAPAPEEPVAKPDPGVAPGGLAAGGRAVVTSDLNLRYLPWYGSGVAAIAPTGTVVEITGAAVDGFYPVAWGGLSGYMHGSYLGWTDAAATPRSGSGDVPVPTDDGSAGNGGGSGSGSAIVGFAMQYVGYPYVWAGEGPYGFDCSGFTLFVIRNVLGTNITHDMFVQYDMGSPVSYGNLQPGDLVFFQNTFQWGLSHVGIYIGNNQFVHAENESTGVKVSDITSDYYSSRYYGAVRFG